jgi:ABC-type arginine transport system permease subunit
MTDADRYFAMDPQRETATGGAYVEVDKDVSAVEFVPGLVFRPVVGNTDREALKGVHEGDRDAGTGLGDSEGETIKGVVQQAAEVARENPPDGTERSSE